MRSLVPHSEPGGAWRRGITTLVAVAVLAVLVGSMIAVFTLVRSGAPGSSTTGSGPNGKPTPSATAPSLALGTTVYTSPVSGDDFYAFAWSPDGKRVASSTMSQVQIWDATTGKHPLTYTPKGQGGSVLTLSWSPDGTRLAVGAVSSDGLEIIDPTTGKLIRVFNQSVASQEQGPGLSAAVAFSGGAGVGATAWSPNGKLMATSFFNLSKGSGGASNVVIWNPATGALVSTLSGQTDVISSLAWSADGAYVAATGYHVGATGESGIAQVWNLSTRKVVFTKTRSQEAALPGRQADCRSCLPAMRTPSRSGMCPRRS